MNYRVFVKVDYADVYLPSFSRDVDLNADSS